MGLIMCLGRWKWILVRCAPLLDFMFPPRLRFPRPFETILKVLFYIAGVTSYGWNPVFVGWFFEMTLILSFEINEICCFYKKWSVNIIMKLELNWKSNHVY